jgi:hypothetical protein
MQWIPEVLSLGVKHPEYEADRSPPSRVKVIYLLRHSSSWRGAELIEYMGVITFALP